MNYKFDNLNDKIPRGQAIHFKLENYLFTERANRRRRKLQHRAMIRRVTHSHVYCLRAPNGICPYDAEIIDNRETETKRQKQNKDLNHKNMIY